MSKGRKTFNIYAFFYRNKWSWKFFPMLLLLFGFTIYLLKRSESLSSQQMGTSSINLSYVNTNENKGAIVMLARGEKQVKKYNSLIRRNLSIMHYVWRCCHMNVIIFHEGDIDTNHQQYISTFTPSMPIQFVNISSIFSQYKKVNNSDCPPTRQSRRFNPGYHSMCFFWTVSFTQYLKDYDWLFRFDADCELKAPSHHLFPQPPDVFFSSSTWLALEQEKYDTISPTKPDGEVVRGMKRLVNRFAKSKHLFPVDIHTWKAPYTNVMYLNLTWLRSNDIVNSFIDVVDKSQCIYSNRWGDSPLWGAATALAGIPCRLLPIAYYHGSHHVLVDSKGNVIQQSRYSFIRFIHSFFLPSL